MQPLNHSTLKVIKVTDTLETDDLAREVFGIAGMPIDAVDMAGLVRRIEIAAAGSTPCLISTANLNFLATSRSDKRFRESLLLSDICTADGMPIVWIARLMGLPIRDRIAGSDLFEGLRSGKFSARRLRVFLFGGAFGMAALACDRLNGEPNENGLACAGWHDPGFCPVDEMNTDVIFNAINSSSADFLIVALGAKKGQEWLLKNHDRIKIPIRAHLGAAINFQAGALKRAPKRIQKLGLEWLWRIMQEPKLWKDRYRHDGLVFLRLLLMEIVPLVILERWSRWTSKTRHLAVTRGQDHKSVTLSLDGAAIAKNVDIALASFQEATSADKSVVINFAKTRLIDARFIGLILMLNKKLKKHGLHLRFSGITPRIERIFRLSGFAYLLRQ
jgi:N-acetylglucosaminyldiphosphoundecaprenol N-acetyl-beta-D-mannosaminyltransferase